MKNIDLNKDYISTSLKNVERESKLTVILNNTNTSTEMLLDSVNEVLNYYCPLQIKPWITQSILKSMGVKNKRHRKMCRTKHIMRKTGLEKLNITKASF